MIRLKEAFETKRMVDDFNLDVRTLTMGISLLDCADKDVNKFNENIYNKITYYAKDLVKVADDLEKEYGIPIINKRISITPIAIAAAACETDSYVSIAKTLDAVAKEVNVDFIGGFSALVQKGTSSSDQILFNSLPESLAVTDRVCASVNLGSSRNGLNMDAVAAMGPMILDMAHRTKDKESIACAKFVAFCNAVDDNPFMAGAYHGVGEKDVVLSVGVSGPGVVKAALVASKKQSFNDLCSTIQETAFKITRAGQLIGQEAAKRLNVPFGIIDLSLAPTPAVGDSIGEIFEVMGLEVAGAPGTTLALALLNDSIKKGGLMASTHVGGLSGAFIPVSEDRAMIKAVKQGALSLEKLEAMTAVCSVGLDMVAVPGDTPWQTLSGIIADEAAIGLINNKTTAVRIIPVYGKTIGEMVEFGGLLGYAPIMKVNQFCNNDFITRGGFVPAPIHSFKN
ncbi:PFL family protein [Erysipelothrix urinaevulpis]|uniref:PFL family protein n=1 Tax=Erysipelothrix urinaevulpis TaxID=2683717 RepID=UPI00135C5AE7|nr:PFL family protein [Erysipelothrix urinaevulpis]